MEPRQISQANGLAPIVGWTEASPTPAHSPLLSEKPNNVSSPSITSSGIDPDISDRNTSTYSSYSPGISNFGDEPVLSSTNDLMDEENIDGSSPLLSEVDDNKNIIVPSKPRQRSPFSQDTSKNPASITYVTENPVCDGVKFVGIDDKDSICSSSSYGSDSDLDEKKDDSSPQIPDGGWGWVIVLASLLLSMVADGISFSFGLLYVEFLDHFNESKSKTSWIGSLFMSVPLMSGPIMSALVDKYGCRKMTMLGGLISCSGFLMAAFANSVETLLLTFGVIAGLGLGLCYVTAVVSIAYWFDKKRSLAVSLGACGTGIGTFVYAPMTQYFIEEYGWRGTIIMLAGTFLNMCVCGAVMRDPEWWVLEQQKQSSSNKSTRGASSCGSISRISGGAESNFPGLDEIKSLMKSGETPEYILSTLVTTIANTKDNTADNTAENEKLKPVCNSVVNLPTFVKQSEKVPMEVLESLSANKKLYNVILENYPSLLHCRSSSHNKLNAIHNNEHITRVPVTMAMKLKASKKPNKFQNGKSFDSNDEVLSSPLISPIKSDDADKQLATKLPILTPIIKAPKVQEPWLKRQFSVNQHYLKNIKVHRHSVMYRGAMMNISKYRLRASSCPNIYRNSMITLHQEDDEKWYTEAWDNVKSMFDFKMFFEFHFLLMSLGTLVLFVWFIVPYFYLAEYMTKSFYTEEEAATMISVIGITNTIGMILLGWAGDQPWMNVTKTYAVCLICCGISTLFYPIIIGNYWLLVTVSALFGLFFASSFSFTPIILVELIPLEKFTLAYGLILLMQGIGNLLGPPLAGFVFDLTQSWDLSFYLAGVFIILSGILTGIIPYTKNFRVIGEAPLEKDLERISQLSQKDSLSIA